MLLNHEYTVTLPRKVEYWIDPNATDKNNPTTLVKKYDDNGSLVSMTLYDEECEILHDFCYVGKAFSKMTDKITGKVCKPMNAYAFMGIELNRL